MTKRVRFAPSPTGRLHIGNLRAALFNWLYARHNDGDFLVRIEDTDLERSKPEYIDSIIASLEWVGITSDEPIVVQSERVAEHRRLLDLLLVQGKAYRCYCTQEEVLTRHQDRFGHEDTFVKYDGHCRILKNSDQLKTHVIRFAIPDDCERVTFNDLIRGTVTFERDQLDDFVIARSDGSPTYNFVVVIDDNFMRITQVIRGEDHISNTPKQIMLYHALGFSLPEFAHVPMILGPTGARLSKRDGATSVLEYKQAGYLPDAFINYLARLGWSHGDQEVFTRQELIDLFTLEGVGKKGAIFDSNKLDWLNGVFMREMTGQDLLVYLETHLIPDFAERVPLWDRQTQIALIDLYKDRTKTVKHLADELIALYSAPTEYNSDDIAKWLTPQARELVDELIKKLELLDHFTVELLQTAIKQWCKDMGIKLVTIAQPIRIALVGKSSSPGVFELLSLLGKEESIRRLQALHKV